MSTKVHIHLHVGDVEKSAEFYGRFFGEPPVKRKPGYVKFLPALGPVNLALSDGGERPIRGNTSHLGIQVDSPALVREALERVRASGLPVEEEMGVDCCHANQDKFWVTDPDGVSWEVYHLNHDIEEPAPSPSASEACCAPTCCQ